jgi:hypothetical protein
MKAGRWGVILLLQITLFLAALTPAQATMLHAHDRASSVHMNANGMAKGRAAQSDTSVSSECADHYHAPSGMIHSQHCSNSHHAHGPDCCMVGGCIQFSLSADFWVSAIHEKRLFIKTDYHLFALGLPPGEAAIPALPPPRILS